MTALASTWLAIALGLPLVVYASIGSFSRYTADDYCWAGVLRTEGFFNAQVLWYTRYSPRYAFTVLVNLVELAGPSIVPFLPAAAIVLLLASLYWTLRQVNLPAPLILAELIALATLQTAPDLPQSLYWQTGMLTYLLPLILATFLAGWIRRASKTGLNPAAMAVCVVVTFFAGGLSETYLIPQNVALTLALVASVAFGRRDVMPYLAAALAGGVLSLVAIVLAPAMNTRVVGGPADLWLASSAAVATAAVQVARLARFFALTVVLCLAVSTLFSKAHSLRTLGLVTASVVIVLPFCYFPSFYAQNGNPPARSLIVPGFILIVYLVYAGQFLRPLISRLPSAIGMVALSVVPLGIAVTTWPERAAAAEYAQLWDAEDALIRARRDVGDLDPTVPGLPRNLGEDFLTADRGHFFNACVARYYGLRSIATS